MVEEIKLDNISNPEEKEPPFEVKPGLLGNFSQATDREILDTIIAAPEDTLIPWEECTLPSKGIYYGWPDGVVKVKAMGQKAEKILATQRLAQSGQSIDYVFRECVKFPLGFDPADLLVGDRTFLLYFLRGITHGNEYEFIIECTNCDTPTSHVYDLNNLASTIMWADETKGLEPFKVELPYLTQATGRSVWVELRHLRSYDLNEIINKRKSKTVRNARKPGPRVSQEVPIDESATDSIERIIVSVMGVTDAGKIRAFIERLHAQDTATIREWAKENTPGIDSTVEIFCPSCGTDFTVDLPITSDFFRPAKKR